MIDKILAPLKNIEKAADKVNSTLEKMEKLASGGLGMAKMAAGIGVAIGGLFALKSALTATLHLFEKGAEMAFDFGKHVVDATRFRGSNISALDLFLGKGKGEGVFNRALEAGKYLPMDERDVVRQVKELAAAGYTGKQMDEVNAALADVQALQGDAQRENLLFHFKRLKNEAAPDARDVKMAAIDTGVGMSGIFKQVYAQMGVAMPKAPDSTEGMFKMAHQYEEWKKHGQVSGNDIANAILRAISERYDAGGKLGGAAVERGDKTLGGLLANLQAAPERFLMQMKLESMPGIKSVMDFIKRLLVFFDHATPQGVKLTVVIEKMINTLFGGLDRIGQKDLERYFEAGVRMAERLIKVVEQLVGEGGLIDQLLHGDFTGLAAAAGGMIVEVGRFLGAGIWEGFKLAIGGQLKQIPGVQQVVLPTAQGITGAAHGMNKVYGTTGTQIGAEASRGLSQSLDSIVPVIKGAWSGAGEAFGSVGKGFEGAWAGMTGKKVPALAEGGVALGAALALVGENGPEAVVPLDRLGNMGGGVQIGTIHVHLSGDDDEQRAHSFVSLLTQELDSSGLRVGAR